ncbi:MAG: metallopeptidase TldD-related protein [Acidobacteriaceae bacterium]|nr:metallopeptidase TldD-related protein [Acidobacteriaceae bacterium]
MKHTFTKAAASAFAGIVFAATLLPAQVNSAAPASSQVLLNAMDTELNRAMRSLGSTGDQPKPYFMSYAVADSDAMSMTAQYGAIVVSNASRNRVVDVQMRLGSRAQDNTHGDHRGSALTTIALPLTDDRAALERTLWYATDRGYAKALDAWMKVKTEQQVRAKEEDGSPDFSEEKPKTDVLAPAPPLKYDKAAWEQRARDLGALFMKFPEIFSNTVTIEASTETDYFVSSEGARVATPNQVARVIIVARTRAADGMDLYRVVTFEADTLGHLPSQQEMIDKTTEMAKNLVALRSAPVTEPFNGPAILSGRATAVFFHEVLGHRLEGQRQRGDEEGQTFTKMLGKQILPSFLSVSDDPTLKDFEGRPLSGHYYYDDEGQQARRVDLIQDGMLKTFLMSRLPIASFAESNGHGRAESGYMPSGRQGNLIVTSSKTVSDQQLRQMLIDEAKKQGKPYGLYFEDISSGFAVTSRRSPQAFQVTPLVVYRVYTDGRPDELVRGVSIVGTPLTALKNILAASDKQDIFNGVCGAESGHIPVSAVAPAMLVSEIETQRQAQGSARPPILPPPPISSAANGEKEAGK